MTKIYTYKGDNANQILAVAKWLRTNGTLNIDYKIHHMNYRVLNVEFINNEVELKYIIEHEWSRK